MGKIKVFCKEWIDELPEMSMMFQFSVTLTFLIALFLNCIDVKTGFITIIFFNIVTWVIIKILCISKFKVISTILSVLFILIVSVYLTVGFLI